MPEESHVVTGHVKLKDVTAVPLISTLAGDVGMKLFLCLILFVCVHHVWSDCAQRCVVTGLLGGQATLPCTYKEKGSFPLSSVRLYWQTDQKELVYGYYNSQSDETHQKHQYKGRVIVFETEVQSGNLSLQIHNLTINDEKNYFCYFFVNTKKVLECHVQLQIAARFSRPVILGPQQEAIRPGEEVNLTCQSSGGYPKPLVNWTDAGGNLLPGQSQVDTTMQPDPVSGLWNVTSVLRVNVTVTSTFLCSIFNIWTQEKQDSEVSNITLNTKPYPQTGAAHAHYLIAIYVLIAAFLCLVVVAIIVFSRKRHKSFYRGVATADGGTNRTGIYNTSTETCNL
ncbi:CD276 antigen-like [Carcharodon carcharias]|uniref:CD276 antigen-like n=1 Tax=Carcharodon carcharias TaxID=13397 RepID=UPI001B7E2820|nr:CD276 antigen-like [Carcharodon carcharias]